MHRITLTRIYISCTYCYNFRNIAILCMELPANILFYNFGDELGYNIKNTGSKLHIYNSSKIYNNKNKRPSNKLASAYKKHFWAKLCLGLNLLDAKNIFNLTALAYF